MKNVKRYDVTAYSLNGELGVHSTISDAGTYVLYSDFQELEKANDKWHKTVEEYMRKNLLVCDMLDKERERSASMQSHLDALQAKLDKAIEQRNKYIMGQYEPYEHCLEVIKEDDEDLERIK